MASDWRLAKSLETLRKECNAAAPNRSKRNDGTIGDRAHQLRDSRHNPNKDKVVTAWDLTHDPENGMNAHKLARELTKNPHPDLYYIISNRGAAYRKTGWKWGLYKGSNPHLGHIHIAVGQGPDGNPTGPYDDTNPWNVKALLGVGSVPKESVYDWADRVIFRPRGSELSGEMLRRLQLDYGLKPIAVLAVTGAETACGRKTLPDNPKAPQRIVTEAHNYGCIKYSSLTTKWGMLAIPNKPFITSDGRRFFMFKDIWTGVAALGRILKVGPDFNSGYYLRMLSQENWVGFARVWYGESVPGFAEYCTNMQNIVKSFRTKAKADGITL